MGSTVPAPPPRGATPVRQRRGRGQRLVRRVHVWTSMLSLAVMVFFGATGILLNHEDWTLGARPSQRTASGTLPAGLRQGQGWDTLRVSEYLANREGLTGRVNGSGSSAGQLWIAWLGPGYSARVSVETASGSYRVSEHRQGLLGALNDIHRAKGTGTPWRVVNDLAGVLLVVIGGTGLLISWLSRARNRRRDLVLAAVGLVLAALAWWGALR